MKATCQWLYLLQLFTDAYQTPWNYMSLWYLGYTAQGAPVSAIECLLVSSLAAKIVILLRPSTATEPLHVSHLCSVFNYLPLLF